jgi:hypothetical protein
VRSARGSVEIRRSRDPSTEISGFGLDRNGVSQSHCNMSSFEHVVNWPPKLWSYHLAGLVYLFRSHSLLARLCSRPFKIQTARPFLLPRGFGAEFDAMISALGLAASVLCIGAPALGQSIVPSVVSSTSASSVSSSSSLSTQITWSQQTWDVVVVGSGPAGIIGNFAVSLTSFHICS